MEIRTGADFAASFQSLSFLFFQILHRNIRSFVKSVADREVACSNIHSLKTKKCETCTRREKEGAPR